MIAFYYLFSCVIAISGVEGLGSVEIAETAVVAVVNGEPITYSAIAVSSEAASTRFTFEHKHAPATEEELRDVEKLRETLETKELAKRIRAVIHQQQTTRLGVAPSAAEIKARSERLLRDADPPATQDATRAKYSVLLDAIRAVHERAEDPDTVYNSLLAGRVSTKDWEIALRQYNTPERRRMLERLVDHNHLSDAELTDAARRVLIMERLKQAIEDDLVRSDPEYAEYVRLASTDPGNETVQSKGPLYRTAKRDEWWQQRYREAKVEIKHERFRGAWEKPPE